MTDNFNIIKEYVKKCLIGSVKLNRNPDNYMVIELIRRGKDSPNLPSANYHFKNYYIYSPDDISKYEDEIKTICNTLNLRAYISVNVKNIQQVMLDTAAEFTRRLSVHDYKKPYSIWESCSGKYVSSGDKKFIIDIDDINSKPKRYIEDIIELIDTKCRNDNRLKERCKFLPNKHPYFGNQYIKYTGNNNDFVYDNVIMTVPTKTGVHIISYGFNQETFKEELKKIFPNIELPDIKINHLTLLYENII